MAEEHVTSRKDKRKAARQEKKQLKHQALLQRQKFRKSKLNDDSRSGVLRNENVKERTDSLMESDSDKGERLHEGTMMKSGQSLNSRVNNNDFSVMESGSEGEDPVPMSKVAFRKSRKDDQISIKKKTKFEEYIEMERKGALMEEDLETEWRLAKKLKVKNGKLKDDDDGLNSLFEGLSDIEQEYNESSGSETMDMESTISRKSKEKKKKKEIKKMVHQSDSDSDASHNEQVKDSYEEGEEILDHETEDIQAAETQNSKKRKRNRKTPDLKGSDNDTSDVKQAKTVCKYVPPHLRPRSDDLQEYINIRRRIRGLLNRMSEANVESITEEVFSMFESIPRAAALQIISEEVLSSCSGGPRGNEQYSSVFAAFVAGMAAMVGIDFGANLLASLAKCFEDEILKEDNLSLRNLSLLLSYLCIFGVCSSPMLVSPAYHIAANFPLLMRASMLGYTGTNWVVVIVCSYFGHWAACGMKLRGDDPAAMKDFILSVQRRVKELKAGSEDAEAAKYGKRMEFMLETICEIKNNKKKAKEDSPQHTRIKKWLQKLRVENITIRGINWNKLLDPEKKGQWWYSGDVSSATENIGKVAGTIDRDVHEAQKMLKLAAKQRMNTDTRRAIFCVIMSAEDYIDAFEQLLSLSLQGKQDRDIMRVLLECCLQEKVFNKYYTALALKLCSHDKNHKFSLQYCLWDQFKELESMTLLRSMHLAKFVADMLAGFALSLAVLKVVDLIDITQLTTKRIMHFRMLFEAIFDHPDKTVWNMFTRVAVTPELEDLCNGMEFFMKEYVVMANKDVSKKFKIAKKALNNVEGVWM